MTVGYRFDGETAGLQDVTEKFSVEIVVLDNEDSLRHCAPDASAPTEAFRDHYLLNGLLTILNSSEDSVKDPSGVCLRALAWVLSDTARADRFLAVTGLDPDGLRASLAEPTTHLAVLEFLCAHEPDLLAAAEALDLSPAQLAAVRDRIEP